MIAALQFAFVLAIAGFLGAYLIHLCKVQPRKLSKEERIRIVRNRYARIFACYDGDRSWDWYITVRKSEDSEIEKIQNEK